MQNLKPKTRKQGFSDGSVVKNLTADAGDTGSIPENPRFSIWENPTCCGATKPGFCNHWGCGLGAATIEAPGLEPMLHSKRSRRDEKPARHN